MNQNLQIVLEEYKILQEKEEILVTSIFFIAHNVLKSFVSQGFNPLPHDDNKAKMLSSVKRHYAANSQLKKFQMQRLQIQSIHRKKKKNVFGRVANIVEKEEKCL